VDFTVKYQKAKGKNEAFHAVKNYLTPEFLSKFQRNLTLETNESDFTMKASGNGVDLKIVFFDSECVVSMNLGFLLKPLQSVIKEKLEEKLSKNL
jgi:Putative polyhydroxyalkanoic acid system protein (PHA_gran_rgn)